MADTRGNFKLFYYIDALLCQAAVNKLAEGLMTFVRNLLFCIRRHSHFEFETIWQHPREF
jgi:hypothetical protein